MKKILRARTECKTGEDVCRAETETEEEKRGDFSEECSWSYLQTGQRSDWLPQGPSSTTPIRLSHIHWLKLSQHWCVCMHSHDCLHNYICMHPCTLERVKGILAFCCLWVLCLSDGAKCLFLFLPLGSVLFLYLCLTARSLICHQRGYTAGYVHTEHIIIRARMHRSVPLRLSLFV